MLQSSVPLIPSLPCPQLVQCLKWYACMSRSGLAKRGPADAAVEFMLRLVLNNLILHAGYTLRRHSHSKMLRWGSGLSGSNSLLHRDHEGAKAICLTQLYTSILNHRLLLRIQVDMQGPFRKSLQGPALLEWAHKDPTYYLVQSLESELGSRGQDGAAHQEALMKHATALLDIYAAYVQDRQKTFVLCLAKLPTDRNSKVHICSFSPPNMDCAPSW